MDEERETQGDLRSELSNLGGNLRRVIHSAWESDERKRIEDEIGSGLEDLIAALRGASDDFRRSPTGQRLQAEVEGLHARVRESEVPAKARAELIAALRRMNAELERLAARQRGGPGGSGGSDAAG
jgi:hypothetical protein